MTPSVALERSTTVDRSTEPASSSAATDAEVPAELFALLLAAFASPAPLVPSPPADEARASSPVAAPLPGALVIDLRTVATLTSASAGDPGAVGVEPPSPTGSVDGEAAAVAELVALDPAEPVAADPVASASAPLTSAAPAVASVAAPTTTARGADAPSGAAPAASVDLALGSGTVPPISSDARAAANPVASGPDAPAVESAAPPVPQPVVPTGSERRADVVRAESRGAESTVTEAFDPSPVPSAATTAPVAPVGSEPTGDAGDGTGSGPGPGPDASLRTRLASPRTVGGDGEVPTVEPAVFGPREVALEASPEALEAASEPTGIQAAPTPSPVASAPIVVRPAALASAAEVHQVAPTPAPVPEQLVDVVAPLRDRGDGSYRLAVDVHPGELGRVRLDVQVDAGTVHISLRADQPATARLLEGSLDQLRQALESSGVATGQLSLSDGGRQQSGGPDRGRGARRGGSDDDPVAVPKTTTPAHRPVSVERALDVLL